MSKDATYDEEDSRLSEVELSELAAIHEIPRQLLDDRGRMKKPSEVNPGVPVRQQIRDLLGRVDRPLIPLEVSLMLFETNRYTSDMSHAMYAMFKRCQLSRRKMGPKMTYHYTLWASGRRTP